VCCSVRPAGARACAACTSARGSETNWMPILLIVGQQLLGLCAGCVVA
jgi:hypothetical protein